MNEGELSISRVTSNKTCDYISLRLAWKGGRVEVTVLLEPFVLALTGRAQQPCEITAMVPFPPEGL